MNQDWLNQCVLDNSFSAILSCALILLLGLGSSGLVAKMLSSITYRIFKKYSHGKFFDAFLRLLRKPFLQLIRLAVAYIALNRLHFPSDWEIGPVSEVGLRWGIHTTVLIAIIVMVARLLARAADFMEYVYHHAEDIETSPDLATFIRRLTQILIYIIGFFVILAKAFEVNITALITSLGIGGLAIALAAQDTLANLIGSFIIYIDKPFNVGELIELGEVRGTVEKIGFRTTRIRTLEKSLLTVPNKKIIDANLINITQSDQRRVKLVLGLTFGSSTEKMKRLMEAIKAAIVEKGDQIDPDITVRFAEIDSSALNIIVLYYVNSNDYDIMIEVKEALNFEILQLVEAEGLQLAYPTQTVQVKQM